MQIAWAELYLFILSRIEWFSCACVLLEGFSTKRTGQFPTPKLKYLTLEGAEILEGEMQREVRETNLWRGNAMGSTSHGGQQQAAMKGGGDVPRILDWEAPVHRIWWRVSAAASAQSTVRRRGARVIPRWKGMEAASRRRGQGVSSPWHRGEAGGVSAGAIAGWGRHRLRDRGLDGRHGACWFIPRAHGGVIRGQFYIRIFFILNFFLHFFTSTFIYYFSPLHLYLKFFLIFLHPFTSCYEARGIAKGGADRRSDDCHIKRWFYFLSFLL
jgi:hypothetical protein